MDLSIVFVNYNSKDYLLKSIASIEAQTMGIDFEIVVIDSGSFDGCQETLRDSYPKVRFVQSRSNIGFAKANNEAFRVTQGRNLLFLNPDTEVIGSAVETLHQYLCTLPTAGVVGAKLLNTDGSVQTLCVRSFPTLFNQILESEALRRSIPSSRLWGMAPLFEETKIPIRVDAVSGACLMIKRLVFERIGMFSNDYFMYSEDVDLCHKVHKARMDTYYIPTAVVVHHGGASTARTNVNTFSTVMMLESRWRFFRKTRSLWYARLYRIAMGGASIVRFGLVFLVWAVRALCGEEHNIEPELKKFKARLRWTLGVERWVKDY